MNLHQQTKVLAGPQNDGGSLIMKSFENFQIRIITDEQGDPWFVAKDVCEALGYTNNRKALSDHVDEEDVTKRDTLTKGGIQAVSCINESGLYSLILGSKLESAKRMKRWVTSEVLPSIRKSGSYGAPAANLPDFSNPAAAARAWAEEYERGQVLAIENKQQQEQIHSLESRHDNGKHIERQDCDPGRLLFGHAATSSAKCGTGRMMVLPILMARACSALAPALRSQPGSMTS